MDNIKTEDPSKIMRDYRNEMRLTTKTALAQITELKKNKQLDEQQQTLLTDLENYIKHIAYLSTC